MRNTMLFLVTVLYLSVSSAQGFTDLTGRAYFTERCPVWDGPDTLYRQGHVPPSGFVSFEQVGPIWWGSTPVFRMSGLDWDPHEKVMYGVTCLFSNVSGDLFSVNIETGDADRILDAMPHNGFQSVAVVNSDMLYAITLGADLYRITRSGSVPRIWEAEFVGNTGHWAVYGLEYDRRSGLLYGHGAPNDEIYTDLYIIDPTDASATKELDMPISIRALAIDDTTGTLLGLDTSRWIWEIDVGQPGNPNDGSWTGLYQLELATAGVELNGFAIVPEPTTCLLTGSAVMWVMLLRRRW